ncbi:MAG: cytochrome d ubiquinol oxidase subunit II [Alphaproteobacteria bacterium 33-17]|nr:MAG: cytochrome d ubiquinol oxidase subunit II [Alphaproteobacteria bacterium 33-17]
MDLAFYLPIIWSIIIGIGVVIYVILDGFDLGIGILFPFIEHDEHKDMMMNSIAPLWDGNETWLILGGAALFGAFPVAYSVILPAMYIPLTIFLVGIILRGVAFEFRFKSHSSKLVWDYMFAAGSTIMTFGQGIVLGTFVQGMKIENLEYVGGSFDWLSTFSVFCGFALVCGYALLGSTWIIMKTDGELQAEMRAKSKKLSMVLFVSIGIISLWTPLMQDDIAKRWFSIPNFLFLAPVPLITLFVAYNLVTSLDKGESKPFFMTILLFIMSYLGLAISIWPYVVPRGITIWEAASPVDSQLFTLVGTLIILPFILFYTYKVYMVFRGKVKIGEGYGH